MRTHNNRHAHKHNNNINNNNNNSRFRRGGGNNHHHGNNRPRTDVDDESLMVSPQQRRHAVNQQTKYTDLAKNARQSGERIEYEYYMQHVEHYVRVINLADEQQRVKDEARRRDHDSRVQQRPAHNSEEETLTPEDAMHTEHQPRAEHQPRHEQPRAEQRQKVPRPQRHHAEEPTRDKPAAVAQETQAQETLPMFLLEQPPILAAESGTTPKIYAEDTVLTPRRRGRPKRRPDDATITKTEQPEEV